MYTITLLIFSPPGVLPNATSNKKMLIAGPRTTQSNFYKLTFTNQQPNYSVVGW